MAADLKILQQIHDKLAQDFLSQLESGLPLHPAMYGHMIKFLKDNNIEALAVKDSPLDKLQGKLHLIKDYLEPHEREAIGE